MVVLYNTTKKIKWVLNKNNLVWYFDNESHSITVNPTKIDCRWTLFINKLHLWFFMANYIFFEKIKFTGKGFKITYWKEKKYMNFLFGHSHLKIILFKRTNIKRLTKYKYILKSKNKQKLKHAANLICNVRKLNIYTKRGLRKIRQFVYKRRGKKSTYI